MPKEEQRSIVEPEHVTNGAQAPSGEPVIQTIPEKFYGAALKAKLAFSTDQPPKSSGQQPAPGAPRPKKGMGMMIFIVLLLLLGAGGGFVYFNQELIFGPKKEAPAPTPAPVTPSTPTPVPPPAAPSNLTATATAATLVQLNWTDASNNESGFRVERRESATAYQPITSLPPNSSAYQDRFMNPKTTYIYRIIAMNEGGESPASNEATADVPELPPPPPENPKLPPAGLDQDSDGLTDVEEPLYGTSPRDPDSDKDTFLDGNEVFHLYNPASSGNTRLLESGLVKPVESSVGWTIYIPTTWRMDLSADGMQGTIMTGHGETFTIAIERNAGGQKILDWYLSRHPGILSSQVVEIKTKSGLNGLEGEDLLTTYFPWGDYVLVFKYNLNDQSFVNFRLTYEMVKNSLRFSAAPAIPDTAVFPEPKPTMSSSTAATSTGTEAPADQGTTSTSSTTADTGLTPDPSTASTSTSTTDQTATGTQP